MVSPAMQLAQKIPERKLQAWAASLLAGRVSLSLSLSLSFSPSLNDTKIWYVYMCMQHVQA